MAYGKNGSINLKAKADMFEFIFKAKSTVQELTKAVMIEIGTRIVNRSIVGNPKYWHPPRWPKNYHPGKFINNWQVGIDSIPNTRIQISDPSGAGSLERLSHLGRWQVGHTFYFVNNMPYARLLEHGMHSWRQRALAPQGIIGMTRLEFKQIVQDVQINYAVRRFKAFGS